MGASLAKKYGVYKIFLSRARSLSLSLSRSLALARVGSLSLTHTHSHTHTHALSLSRSLLVWTSAVFTRSSRRLFCSFSILSWLLSVCVWVCVCVCVCVCADFVGTKRVGECVLHRVPNVRPSPRPHHQHCKHVFYSGFFVCSKVAFWDLCTHHAPGPHLEYFKSV